MNTASSTSLDMIKKLIAFDTTSHKSNLELIQFIRDYLAESGIDSTLYKDETGEKANLYATLGPDDRPGIALSGHTDVVPVAGQDWSSDPFVAVERDGRIYGRGTCDMKSFIAVVLAKVPDFLARGLETPIHLAFSHDEEIGCLGVRSLLAGLERLPIRPAGCIVGEPTDMKVIRGHKGKLSMQCHVRGLAAHSSLVEHGVNAIENAAAVVGYLSAMAERLRREGPHDEGYDPPYTSVHTGIINGGTQLNIIPQDCMFEFEFRNLPGNDPQALMAEIRKFVEEEIEPAMRDVDPDTGFRWQPLSGFPGLDTPENAEITLLAKALAGANDTRKVSFGTEAGLFSDSGIPAVVCGPGSIEQAHKPDEFVSLEQVARCDQFLDRLMDRVGSV
ncbi:MAG: acetylornithine deacetylase [Alphaproteobacteria bacterium]|nr:acetylornithine deacetylase [Alphaproteobacteria bacterium]